MKQCAHTKVWQTIVAEAREQAEQEPMLASFYHATIIKHDSLKAALSYILANRLNTASMPAMAVREVIEEAFAADPSISEAAACDICATVNRDPAVSMYSMPLLYLKGYHALQGYRVANWLWRQGRKALATYFQNQISVACQVDIHPAARIGRGIMLDHATGIVIGETAVVEDDVSILQDVTLGGTGKECGDRHPKIREGVMIGAGAKILGNIEVGEGAKLVLARSCYKLYRPIPQSLEYLLVLWGGHNQISLLWIWISSLMVVRRHLSAVMVSRGSLYLSSHGI